MTDRHLYVSDDGFFMTETEVFERWKELPGHVAVDLVGPRALREVRAYRRRLESVATEGGRVLEHASLALDEALPCPPQPPAGRDHGS